MSEETNQNTEAPVEQTTVLVPQEETSTMTALPESEVLQEKISTFQAQLVQSLELNDKLIDEVKNKEKEVSVFKEITHGLKGVIAEKDNEISQLKNIVQELKLAKFNERKREIETKWIRKFGLSEDKFGTVQKMLSKFTSEDELVEIEQMLELTSVKEQVEPMPLTQSSTVLQEQSFQTPVVDMSRMSAQEKLDYLYSKMSAFNQK